ncbi:uncharacterized protein [Antedon mediterranea]|uniref:uncharacterized protein n=1 Tax=Antedon mediterranea TaxID=105859 RepID=UPI003AF89E2D
MSNEIKLRNANIVAIQNILIQTGPNTIDQLYSRFRNTIKPNFTILKMFGFNSAEFLVSVKFFPQYFNVKGREITNAKLLQSDIKQINKVPGKPPKQVVKVQDGFDNKQQNIVKLKTIILQRPNKFVKLEELYSIYCKKTKGQNKPGLGTTIESFRESLTSLKEFHISNKKNVSVLSSTKATEKKALTQEQQYLQSDVVSSVSNQLLLHNGTSDCQVVSPDDVSDHQDIRDSIDVVDRSTSDVVSKFLTMNKRDYEQPIIALHTEGFYNNTKYVITGIGMASWDADVCVIEFPNGNDGHLHIKEKECLKELLEDPNILKVCHDVRLMSKALYDQFQIQLAYIFDTKICFQILTKQQIAAVTFKQVCEFLNVTYPKEAHLKNIVTTMVPAVYRNLLTLLRTTEDLISFGQACRAVLEVARDIKETGHPKFLTLRAASGYSATDVKKIPQEGSLFKEVRSQQKFSQAVPLSKRNKVSTSVSQLVKENTARFLQFDNNGIAFFLPEGSEDLESVNPTNITQKMLDSVKENNQRDMQLFLDVFPDEIKEVLFFLHQQDGIYSLDLLIEVVLDIGRKPHARYYQLESGKCVTRYLLDTVITSHQVEDIFSGNKFTEFSSDRRAGIEGTLHRVSNIVNKQLKPVGLTARVGRAIYGCLDMIFDIVASHKSVLILGSPGVGKTTVLREYARLLSDVMRRRVMIVDTSNEIGGDGDSLHDSLGSARRLQVHPRSEQYKFMIEAVQNHNPEVIIIDEMGSIQEAQAAQSIAERGVQLIATAHGQSCADIHRNPSLRPIAGSAHSVILGKEEVKTRKSQTKTVLERQRDPSFDVLIELRERDCWIIHHNLADSIDAHLKGSNPQVEVRKRVIKTTASGESFQEIRASLCTMNDGML